MNSPLSPGVLFALAVVALVGVYLTQRKDFVFRARPGRFECWGRVPLVKQEEVARFLLEDLAVREPVKVMGRWGPGGRLVPPGRPGLGLEVDPDAVGRYRAQP